ncbi:MAG TPA: hypothetical protein VGL34_31160 [Steroidobacteraceae bacterium]
MSGHRGNQMAATSVAAIVAMAATLLCLVGCASTGGKFAASAGKGAGASAGAALTIDSLHMSAAGTLIDLRYRVVDAERAGRVLGPKIRPRLIDEASGIEMAVPNTAKLGSLRQTQGTQREGRTYFVLFVNSARIGPGSRVTAELGELRFQHLLVE